METSAHGITAPSAVYEIAGRRFEIGTRGFADAVADSHAAHQRPRSRTRRSSHQDRRATNPDERATCQSTAARTDASDATIVTPCFARVTAV